MQELSVTQRAESLRRMASEGVDVLVIGGGITGAGVALDAAARGYRVGLVEKNDFASGTSSKSTKLVHGGIRYLPQLDFPLVREALVERGLLARNAPFLVRPIAFILPLYAENRRPLGTPIAPPFGIGLRYLLRAGLLLYDLLAGRLGMHTHRRIGPRRAAQAVPCLKTEGLLDAFVYYDAQTDDTRLTATVARSAAQHGALLANHAELIGFEQAGGRIVAADVLDHLSGDRLTIPVERVVNAGGVWAGRIEALTGGESRIRIEPAKGVHLTVPRERLKIRREAIVLPETEDGRILFIVPSGPRVIIGTTDTEGGDVDRPVASPDDIAYLLRHVNRYMSCDLQESDIISAWAGYRPLLSSRRGETPSSRLSRTHAVIDGPGGMVTIVGGKLTTYRRMAQDAVDHVSRLLGDSICHVTIDLPLVGAMGWRQATEELRQTAPYYRLRPDTVRHLESYGSAARSILGLLAEEPSLAERIVPDLPYIMAEVSFTCRLEMAVTLEDVLDRRLHISMEDRAHGLGVAHKVAAHMAPLLHWEAAEIEGQVESYRRFVTQETLDRSRASAAP